MARNSPRYNAWLDVDDLPLTFVQTDQPFITVQPIGTNSIGWTQHRTDTAAINRARRDKTRAYSFNGIHGRWDPMPAPEV